jgi:hypothetical protein
MYLPGIHVVCAAQLSAFNAAEKRPAAQAEQARLVKVAGAVLTKLPGLQFGHSQSVAHSCE